MLKTCAGYASVDIPCTFVCLLLKLPRCIQFAVMETFVQFLSTHIASQATLDELLSQLHVQIFERGQVYCREDERRPYWCYVGSGLVGAYYCRPSKRPYLHWVASEGHYFTGTKHEYSSSGQLLHVEFLKKSKVISIHLHRLRTLQEKDFDLQRLFNILRQRTSTFFDRKTLIMAQDAQDRYAMLCRLFPQLILMLNNEQLSQFLAINPKTLYKSRKEALFRK